MAKKASAPAKASGGMLRDLDDTYTTNYKGGVTINKYAVLEEEIKFNENAVNSLDYYPTEATFIMKKGNVKYILSGTFTVVPPEN